MYGALETMGIKYSSVETLLLFAPPIKISGYAPATDNVITPTNKLSPD